MSATMIAGVAPAHFGRPQDLRHRLPMRACRFEGVAMGTGWSAQAGLPVGVDPGHVERELIDRLERVDRQMSTWRADSTLMRFNHAPAGQWCTLEPEFFDVMQAALRVARDSGGACDPTVGPLVELWGFGAHAAQRRPGYLPDAAAIQAALARVGWQRLRFDAATRRLLQPGDAALDLSGIAKGHAVDLLAETLRHHGAHDLLVEIGGELRGAGLRPDRRPWQVSIEVDDDGRRWQSPPIRLVDAAIATSGDGVQFFEHAGRRYSHTLNPRSGEPISATLASVSVALPHCMDADGWATALNVMGFEVGWRHACRQRMAALFVTRDAGGLRAHPTPVMAALFASAERTS